MWYDKLQSHGYITHGNMHVELKGGQSVSGCGLIMIYSHVQFTNEGEPSQGMG